MYQSVLTNVPFIVDYGPMLNLREVNVVNNSEQFKKDTHSEACV